MQANKWIYAMLTGNSGVSALAGTRIYPVMIPKDETTYPAIAFSDTYTPADGSKDAPTHHNCTVTIHCWAAEYDEAAALDNAVRLALDYQDNGGAGVTAGGVTVDVCEWQNSNPGIEEVLSGNGGAPFFFRESIYFLREQL